MIDIYVMKLILSYYLRNVECRHSGFRRCEGGTEGQSPFLRSPHELGVTKMAAFMTVLH